MPSDSGGKTAIVHSDADQQSIYLYLYMYQDTYKCDYQHISVNMYLQSELNSSYKMFPMILDKYTMVINVLGFEVNKCFVSDHQLQIQF